MLAEERLPAPEAHRSNVFYLGPRPKASMPMPPPAQALVGDFRLLALCARLAPVLAALRRNEEAYGSAEGSAADRLLAESYALQDIFHPVRAVIAATPARTLPGIVAKAKVANATWNADGADWAQGLDDEHDLIAASLIRDVLKWGVC